MKTEPARQVTRWTPGGVLFLGAVDFPAADGVLEFAEAEGGERPEDGTNASLQAGEEALVFAEKNRAAGQKIGPLERRIAGAPLVPHGGRRDEQDLAGAAPDLGGQVGIAAELSVAFVDLAERLDEIYAHHEGG